MTRRLEKDDISAIFSCTRTCRKLFPENRLVCNWMPFCLLESNIPFIMINSTSIIGSFNPDCVLMTCETSYKCARGAVCNINIYGNDFEHMDDHLTKHIEQCKEKFTNQSIFISVFCVDRAKDTTDELMKKYGLKQNSSPMFRNYYVVEKSIKSA